MSAVLPRLDGRRKRAEKIAVLLTAALVAALFVLLGCSSSQTGPAVRVEAAATAPGHW